MNKMREDPVRANFGSRLMNAIDQREFDSWREAQPDSLTTNRNYLRDGYLLKRKFTRS